MKRCIQTVDLITNNNNIILDDNLIEYGNDLCNIKSKKKDIDSFIFKNCINNNYIINFIDDNYNYNIYRDKIFLNKIIKIVPSNNKILVVTHGNWLEYLYKNSFNILGNRLKNAESQTIELIIGKLDKTRVSPVIGNQRVSTVTVIWKNNNINYILVCRRGVYGNGYKTLISQGGTVESNETFKEGAVREAKEEAGIKIKKSQLILVNETVNGNTHFKNYYVIYNNEPFVEGPPSKFENELLNINNILGYNTIKYNNKNTRLAWIPIDELIKDPEKTQFKKIINQIKTKI